MKKFSEFHEGYDNPIIAQNEFFAKYHKLKDRLTIDQKKELISSGYAKLSAFLGKVKQDLQRLILDAIRSHHYKGDVNVKDPAQDERVGSEAPTVLINIKSQTSFLDKVINRGKSPSAIGDMVRCAILFKDKGEADSFVKQMIHKYKAFVSGYEHKDPGGANQLGYFGSHHLDLKVDGMNVEVQVMTKRLWRYKEAAHSIYNSVRSDMNKLTPGMAQDSRKIFALGNKPAFSREEIEHWHEFAEGMYEIGLTDQTVILEFSLGLPKSSFQIDRKDMPQIYSDQHDEFMKHMKDTYGIASERTTMKPKNMKPTQSEFNADKVTHVISKGVRSDEKPILVAGDGHILDGHHRWAAQYIEDKDNPLNVIKFQAPIESLVQYARQWSGSTRRGINEGIFSAFLRK